MPPPPPSHRCRVHALQAMGIAALAAAWPSGLPRAADAGTMAVVYPEIGEPFRSVFASIVEGIREQARQAVPGFAIGADATMPTLVDELRKREVRVVIALGRSGLKAAEALDRSVGVVVGCVLAVPEAQAQAYTVHSLAPDPALIFAQVRRMLPTARRIWAVHDPQQNTWLMRLAQEAAKTLGLELMAQEASDLQRATKAYQDIVVAAEPQRDVLWLPQDSTTVEEATLLPLVLQVAWRRKFAVISSNAQHVRRGALFALYADNPAMGRSLAQSAFDTLASAKRPARGLLPLRDVLVAANQRTAAHLGLELDPRGQRIAKLYPES